MQIRRTRAENKETCVAQLRHLLALARTEPAKALEAKGYLACMEEMLMFKQEHGKSELDKFKQQIQDRLNSESAPQNEPGDANG